MRVRPRRFFFSLSPLPLTCASPTGGARRGGLAGKRAGSPRLAPSLREGGENWRRLECATLGEDAGGDLCSPSVSTPPIRLLIR